MPRIKLILNPVADRGHAWKSEPDLRRIVQEEIEKTGDVDAYDLTWVSTEYPLHATELASEKGYDAVVALGGDGVVHEIVNGLMTFDADQRPRLGVIPIGSGNDFAHNVGLPDDPHEAARCIIGDITRPIDAGIITDGTGRSEYWNNTVGIAFSGAVNIAGRKRTKMRGFLVYFVAVLETILFKPADLDATFKIDDQQLFDRRVSMISVNNGPREGGGFPTSPNAIMDDGLLTYTLMRHVGRLGMLRFLPVVMAANHLKYTKIFDNNTAKHMNIKGQQTMVIHTDGEVYGPWEANIREVDISIIPGALQVLCSC
jgi:YegS/Rv2252/BmrU family lipid kinase